MTQSRVVEVKNTVPQAGNSSQQTTIQPVTDIGGQNILDEIERIIEIEPLNETTAKDKQEPTITPIPELGQLNVDLMTFKK